MSSRLRSVVVTAPDPNRARMHARDLIERREGGWVLRVLSIRPVKNTTRADTGWGVVTDWTVTAEVE